MSEVKVGTQWAVTPISTGDPGAVLEGPGPAAASTPREALRAAPSLQPRTDPLPAPPPVRTAPSAPGAGAGREPRLRFPTGGAGLRGRAVTSRAEAAPPPAARFASAVPGPGRGGATFPPGRPCASRSPGPPAPRPSEHLQPRSRVQPRPPGPAPRRLPARTPPEARPRGSSSATPWAEGAAGPGARQQSALQAKVADALGGQPRV